jgi:hypothetical protein
MPRKASPNAAPYLRRVLGIPLNVRILPANDLYRLEFATALVNFVGKERPKKTAMAEFIQTYARENGVSTSFCYKIRAKLIMLTIIKFDPYSNEYAYNENRFKRDLKALNQFKTQVEKWRKDVTY